MNRIKTQKVKYPTNMPLELKEILNGMMQKNPETRFSY